MTLFFVWLVTGAPETGLAVDNNPLDDSQRIDVSGEYERNPAGKELLKARDLDARDTHQVEETALRYDLDGADIRVGTWDHCVYERHTWSSTAA